MFGRADGLLRAAAIRLHPNRYTATFPTPPLCRYQIWVMKVSDYRLSCPGHGNKDQKSCNEKITPETIHVLAFNASFFMQAVHLPPTIAMSTPKNPSIMDITTITRAAWRS
ncbi:hypothetical protein WMY93_007679 [Mugilogobius chulae]|uniref:Uncharacterized protein n=1 Tax=Mugilogobius chulae TaxID=88201 RepID=A0AAW0PDP4_9GOBI